MNKELLEKEWSEVKEIIGQRWNNLTREDLKEINGRYDQLIAHLQKSYGYSKEQAEDEVRRFNLDKAPRSQAETGSYRRAEERSHDNFSWLRTLVLIGIPLLLLGYFFTTSRESAENKNVVTTPSAIGTERVISVDQGPLDLLTTENIFAGLTSQNFKAGDFANIQISTNKGVVTLTGYVSSQQQRDFIEKTARNTYGVTRVDNQITIK